MSDFVPTPYILDVGVLTDIARGVGELIGLMRDYDRIGQPLVASVLAAAGALRDAGEEAASAGTNHHTHWTIRCTSSRSPIPMGESASSWIPRPCHESRPR